MATDNIKEKTKKGLYWKFAEQFSNYGVQFIIGIFMARMLSPEDYGITALPAVFMAIAGIFTSGGFYAAMVRKSDLNDSDLSTAFYYSTCVGFLMYLVLFSASPWIAEFYNAPVLKPLMRVTALGFIYGPLGTPLSIILTRKMDFATPMKIGVVSRILTGCLGIALAYTGYGVWALVISTMFGDIFVILCRWYVVRWYPRAKWSKDSFKYLWGFGNKLMASSLLDTIYGSITPIFIGKFYSPAELGVYNRAQGYAALPSQNITTTLAQVTFPALSNMQEDEVRLANAYRKMLRVSAFIVFPLMMGLAALARPLIIVMITAKWEACIIYLQIICFSMMWYPIHAINLNLLQVKGRSDLFLRLEIIKKIWGLSLMIITLPLGVIYFCSAGIVSSIFCLFVNTYYTGKLINVGFIKQIKDLLPTLLLAFLMYACTYSITLVFSNMYLQLIAGFLVGFIVYLGGAYCMKFEELKEVIYLLQRKK